MELQPEKKRKNRVGLWEMLDENFQSWLKDINSTQSYPNQDNRQKAIYRPNCWKPEPKYKGNGMFEELKGKKKVKTGNLDAYIHGKYF